MSPLYFYLFVAFCFSSISGIQIINSGGFRQPPPCMRGVDNRERELMPNFSELKTFIKNMKFNCEDKQNGLSCGISFTDDPIYNRTYKNEFELLKRTK